MLDIIGLLPKFLVLFLSRSFVLAQQAPPMPTPPFTGNMPGHLFVANTSDSGSHTSSPATTSVPVTEPTDLVLSNPTPTNIPAAILNATFPVKPPSPLPPGAGTPIHVPMVSSSSTNVLAPISGHSIVEGTPHEGAPESSSHTDNIEENHDIPQGPGFGAPMHWPGFLPPFYGHHPFPGVPPMGSGFGHPPFHMAGMPPMPFIPHPNMTGMNNSPFAGSMPSMLPMSPVRSAVPRAVSHGTLRRMGVSLDSRALTQGSVVLVRLGVPINGTSVHKSGSTGSLTPVSGSTAVVANNAAASINVNNDGMNQTTIAPVMPANSEKVRQLGDPNQLVRSMLSALPADGSVDI